MEENLISVIVPAYNVENYIDKCIESIINQTYKNLEILIVDDGSTDNTGKKIDNWATKDNRITVIHIENEGLAVARNTLLDLAKGEYIGFVDSDDYIEPNMYEELLNAIKKNSCDISICSFTNVYEDGTKKKKHKDDTIEEIWTPTRCLYQLYEPDQDIMSLAWNKLYKRKVWDNIRYPEHRIYEDAYVITDIIDVIDKAFFMSKSLYNRQMRQESIMGKSKKITEKNLMILDVFKKRCEKYEGIADKVLYSKMVDEYMHSLIAYYKQVEEILNNRKICESIYNDFTRCYKKHKNVVKKMSLKKKVRNVLFITSVGFKNR